MKLSLKGYVITTDSIKGSAICSDVAHKIDNEFVWNRVPFLLQHFDNCWMVPGASVRTVRGILIVSRTCSMGFKLGEREGQLISR